MQTYQLLICTFRQKYKNYFVNCFFSSPTSVYALPYSILKLLCLLWIYGCAVIFYVDIKILKIEYKNYSLNI